MYVFLLSNFKIHGLVKYHLSNEGDFWKFVITYINVLSCIVKYHICK